MLIQSAIECLAEIATRHLAFSNAFAVPFNCCSIQWCHQCSQYANLVKMQLMLKAWRLQYMCACVCISIIAHFTVANVVCEMLKACGGTHTYIIYTYALHYNKILIVMQYIYMCEHFCMWVCVSKYIRSICSPLWPFWRQFAIHFVRLCRQRSAYEAVKSVEMHTQKSELRQSSAKYWTAFVHKFFNFRIRLIIRWLFGLV